MHLQKNEQQRHNYNPVNFTKNTQTTQTEQYILLGRRRTEGYKKKANRPLIIS